MCGIIGEINKSKKVDLIHFDGLRDRMFHRGPDGAGSEYFRNDTIALGHRRLSIIDLTENAKQPMCNEDASIWITFNGEIYNYKDLKNELESKHIFSSNSDTEVLLHGYEEWGLPLLLNKLKGMFAFGLFDIKKNKVFIARDRFGIKPLVYAFNNERFLFASELKSIANHRSFIKTLDWNSIADYFTYSYVPFPNSIWKGANKLPPAHYGTLNLDSFELELTQYWSLKCDDRLINDVEAVEESNRLIKKATQDHLISDVPIGLFLSGGYDSNTLLINMLDIGYKPNVFTIAFPGNVNNEAEQAKSVAKYLGVDHFVEEIRPEANVFDLLCEISPYYDEPFAGSSMINNHLIAKLASQSLKVAFSGEGADEVFAGYKWHHKIELYYKASELKQLLRRFKNGELSKCNEFLNLYNRSMLGVKNEDIDLNILSFNLRTKIAERAFWHFDANLLEMEDKVKQTQYLDYKTFIPNHCLHRADISSMANSLEVRVPFLDHEIYEFVFSLNRKVYMKEGVKKFLLGSQLRNRIPQQVLNMPKKGFSFHFSGQNFDKSFKDFLVDGELIKAGIIKANNLNLKLSDNFKFHLLNLELWFRNHA